MRSLNDREIFSELVNSNAWKFNLEVSTTSNGCLTMFCLWINVFSIHMCIFQKVVRLRERASLVRTILSWKFRATRNHRWVVHAYTLECFEVIGRLCWNIFLATHGWVLVYASAGVLYPNFFWEYLSTVLLTSRNLYHQRSFRNPVGPFQMPIRYFSISASEWLVVN